MKSEQPSNDLTDDQWERVAPLIPAQGLLDLARQDVANLRRVEAALQKAVDAGGEPVGNQYEGERKFDIVARFDRRTKESVAAIGRLPVYTADGQPVPLSQVALIEVVDGQTLIARESGRRRITVRCDIVGRDQGGFVKEAQEKFDAEIASSVPTGYKVGWLGMFENLARARERFAYVIPITVGLLLVTFGSFRAAFLVLLGVPFACVGGVLALEARGMHVNVSTGVGFCAVRDRDHGRGADGPGDQRPSGNRSRTP